MKRNKTLSEAWEQIGDIRNAIKDTVKEQMGWKADAVFYDRVKGRVECTPAEQSAFQSAFKAAGADLKNIINTTDLFPANDFRHETVE